MQFYSWESKRRRERGLDEWGRWRAANQDFLLATNICRHKVLSIRQEPGFEPSSVSGPRGSFGDGRAMRTAVASKFRQSAGDGTLRIGEMRGSHPCAWHSAAATCGAAVALSALASLLGDWGRSPQQAGACLTLWSEVPEENWPFLLKILAMSVMGAGDALAMSPRRLPSFSQPWLAMAFGQSPARAVFWPDFASIWRFRQLSETLEPSDSRGLASSHYSHHARSGSGHGE